MPNAPSGPFSPRPPFWALLGALAVTAAGGVRIPQLRRRVSAHSGAHTGPSQRDGADGVGTTAYARTHTTQEQTDTTMPDLISRALTRRTVRTTKPSRERTWKDLSPLLRLLILTQLTSGIGFFAVLPFLAEHLGTALGMAGWMVGFVLGLRTFSQQGLFVVGGALVDRYGVRPIVLAGCVVRVAGFAIEGTPEGQGSSASRVGGVRAAGSFHQAGFG